MLKDVEELLACYEKRKWEYVDVLTRNVKHNGGDDIMNVDKKAEDLDIMVKKITVGL